MASQLITTLVDDIDGSDAAETVSFSLDGVDYAIDLSTVNAAALRRAIASWASAGRRMGGAPTSRRVLKPVGDSRGALIRAWAAREGLAVPARGRIPRDLQRQYDAAH
jgi:hypothetical protein